MFYVRVLYIYIYTDILNDHDTSHVGYNKLKEDWGYKKNTRHSKKNHRIAKRWF